MDAINSNYETQQYSSLKNGIIGTLGVAAGWEGQTFITQKAKYPLKKYVKKNIKNIQGGGYLAYVEKAIKQNHLQNDIKVINLTSKNAKNAKKQLKVDLKSHKGVAKFILHLLRVPCNNDSFEATVKGKNAFFSPRDNAVVCNFDKLGAPIFHELQHKLNSQSSNLLIKTLAKIRNPLAVFGSLAISACAIFTDKKEKGEKTNIYDNIKNYCGLLTACSFLPLTIEECIANVKGTKIAEKAGVKGEALKRVKNAHKLSIISYVSSMFIVGFGAWAGNKIRDEICKMKIKQKGARE